MRPGEAGSTALNDKNLNENSRYKSRSKSSPFNDIIKPNVTWNSPLWNSKYSETSKRDWPSAFRSSTIKNANGLLTVADNANDQVRQEAAGAVDRRRMMAIFFLPPRTFNQVIVFPLFCRERPADLLPAFFFLKARKKQLIRCFVDPKERGKRTRSEKLAQSESKPLGIFV